MPKVATFISFDFDNDDFLRTAVVGQSQLPDSPFDIADRSLHEPLIGDWKAKIRGRIQRSELVIVICGQNTHNATGVAAELEIARELGKPYFLLRGYSDKVCSKPTTALTTDKVYDWTWDNLKILINGGR